MDTIYLTRKGLDTLRKDLNLLVNIERPTAAQELATAREKGDLSENAEYAAAREKLASIDRRIGRLQEKLSSVQLLESDDLSSDEVRILTRVKMVNVSSKREAEYTLVDPVQADPARKLISVKSPIARGILGKRVGEEVKIDVPSGEVTFKILSIQPSEGL